MKLTLVRPNMGRRTDGPYVDEGRMEPLQLGLLAALCPPDVEVSLVDDRCEPVPYDTPTELVAITVETFTARRAYEIAAEYQRRHVPVVVGGFHPTLLPQEAARHADSVVTGDAESVWADVLGDFRAGALKPLYRGEGGAPQSGVIPRRDLFMGKGYLPLALAQFGRGCPHGCAFCAVSAYFGRQHRYRPVDEVVREIEPLKGRLVFFVDDNIVANVPAAKQLFRALIPLRIQWVSQGTIDMVRDPELMSLMHESGCLGHVIGFETTDGQTMQATGKATNAGGSGQYDEAIGILKSHSLQTWAAFTLGYDQDTPDTLYGLLDFALRHKFAFAAFNVLMPYPGTPLYARLQREDRLLYDGRWWLHPDYRFNHAAFRPTGMTADELTRIAFDIRSRWNSPGALLRRFLDIRTNMRTVGRMSTYWLYNSLFRREVFRKQDMMLGGAR